MYWKFFLPLLLRGCCTDYMTLHSVTVQPVHVFRMVHVFSLQAGLEDWHIQSFIIGLVAKTAFQGFLKPYTALNHTYGPPTYM